MALDFDVAPYYDDSAVPGGAIYNNYMRILFRPGYAVQARELTALQTILQNQISTLGDFVFQNGSPVTGGHISLDTTVKAIQLQTQYANSDIDLTNFLVNGNATLIISANASVKAVVVATDSTQTNPTIIVKYLTAAVFHDGDVIQVATGLQSQAQLIAGTGNTATSPASVASINEGIFFSKGFFVQVNPQTILLDSTTNLPTYRIGLQISENIVDEITDSNLLDPAQGSFNYQAPGATRYQYSLSLAKRTLSSIDDSAFYELLRVQNGLITKQIDYPVFADLDKALAQRTFDTSGDFTVTPFALTVQDNPANTSQYYLVLEPGKAYVKGFEFHTIGTQKLVADKARQTNTITDYGMALDFGNYVIAANLNGGNVSGLFDITQLQTIDIHCIVSGNIVSTNVQNYGLTKAGTARVRDIEFLGLSNYFVYLTDINLTPATFIATAGNANSVTMPAKYAAAPANCYANVMLTVNTSGIVDTRTVTSYSSQVLTLDRPLSTNATNISNCALIFGIKDMDSGVITPTAFSANVFATQSAANGDFACFDISVGGRDAHGNTILSDTKFNKLIFPLPQNYVAQATISNASFEARKNLWSQTFTSGNLTISSGSGLGAGQSFPYGYSGYLPDIVANTNFIVVVKNAMSSGYANGTVLNFNRGSFANGNAVFQTDSTHVTIVTSAAATFVGDVICTVEVSNASSGAVARRTKTLVGNSAQTSLQTGAVNAWATRVISGTNANTAYIDTANGYVWFQSNSVMAMTPGSRQSLYVPDVFNVLKVFDSGNTSYAPNTSNSLLDITTNYYLDSGQRDGYYDHAALILKPGANPPAGQTVALIQYYQPDTIGSQVLGFFDADSYTSNIYSSGLIPYYSSQNFGAISLRDSIDFRPVRTIGMSANVDSYVFNGLLTPYPDAAMILSFGYYLPRVDKLMLSKDKVFRISQGVPAQYPIAPGDSDDAMTLYIITLPAYTGNVYQVQHQYVEHKRYTMQDIGVLDTRIHALELQSALNALEQQAIEEKILYNDGVTVKDQYGVLADDFGNFSICDNKSRDLYCYMAQGSLTPYKDTRTHELNFQSNTAAYYLNGKCYCLPFTETAAIIQNTATTYISVQPFLFGQFKGVTILTPEIISGFSSNIAPVIITPPVSPALDQPPVPSPTPAPTLPSAPLQAGVTTVSMLRDYGSFADYTDLYDYRNGNIYYTRIPNRTAGYGGIGPFYNWVGVPKETTTTAPAVSVIPNSGSSVQLAAGTSQTAAVAAQNRVNVLPLFGSRLL